jgi:hypothetical protein
MSEQQLVGPAPSHPADGTAESTTTPAIEPRGVVRIIVPALDARPGHKLEITVRPVTSRHPVKQATRGGKGGAAGAGSGRENACALRGTVTEVVYLGTSANYNVITSARRGGRGLAG